MANTASFFSDGALLLVAKDRVCVRFSDSKKVFLTPAITKAKNMLLKSVSYECWPLAWPLLPVKQGLLVYASNEGGVMKSKITFKAVAIVAAFAFQALALPFVGVSNNNASNIVIGEAQLSWSLTDLGGGEVEFVFGNSGPAASSITDIYFDDDTPFLTFDSFNYLTSGVAYTIGANPGNLPGGNSIAFSSNYAFDSDNPVQPQGINPGESLGIVFDLVGGNTYAGLLGAIDAGTFRIGAHVQGFADGGSEAFVNATAQIPEPTLISLLGLGIIGLAALRRRK